MPLLSDRREPLTHMLLCSHRDVAERLREQQRRQEQEALAHARALEQLEVTKVWHPCCLCQLFPAAVLWTSISQGVSGC